MSFRINPQEFHVRAETYFIRTMVPKDSLEDDMVLGRVKNAGLQAGDRVAVQCFAPGYDAGEGTGVLLYEAEYRVTGKSSALKTYQQNDRESRTVSETDYMIERFGDWWATVEGKAHAKASKQKEAA